MQTRAELKGAYALLKNPKVTHERLQAPHWAATRQATADEPVVLMVQDTAELDYTHYADTMHGLGPIGNGGGRGLLLHSTLAIVPESRRVLGIAHQRIALRVPIPEGTTRRQRPPEERESRLWWEAVRELGSPPAGTRWVLVADRGADQNTLWAQCDATRMDFLIRVCYEHRLLSPSPEAEYLLSTVRQWPSRGEQHLPLCATPKRKAREARMQISFGPLEVRVSRKRNAPGLRLWAVRSWEPDPPLGAEAVEWILVTSCAVETLEEAKQMLAWYTARWLVEDYHQCLKTGCAVERRDLEQRERIERLLGFLALVALRLLQLRQEVRQEPERPAHQVAPAMAVALMAARLKKKPEQLSVREFWRAVANLGGFLGRKRDGEPGWKTLWRGWLEVEAWMQGIELATHASLLELHPATYG
jgi:hypothetical protein